MAIKGYNFKTAAIKVATPEAKTLFMCLAEVNEYTGKYGGKLIFTPEQINTEVGFTQVGSAKAKKPFGQVVNDLLDEAYTEYTTDTGKKAKKVAKIVPATDADGNETGNFELGCTNQAQPKIMNPDRTVEKDYQVLVGNGSTVKASLYLKPYVMQGKVGVTAYLNGVLLLDIIEFGGGDDLFDDDDFASESDDDTLSDEF